MLKIGLFGAGHLGKIHIKCIKDLDQYHLVGFHDPNPEVAKTVAEKYGIRHFNQPEALMDDVEVVDIVTPTPFHYQLASEAMKRGKHVFIEKPVTHKLEEARTLIQLQKKHGVKVQIGHVERFNPAFLALKDMVLEPLFIEAHRLAIFNPRGTDVSVVMDLMIHDLDILLHTVNSEVKDIQASGVAVVSNTPDITNARITFQNGAVANLTASRISLKQMRKIRLFQRDAYISVDFLEKNAQIVRLFDKDASEVSDKTNLMELNTERGTKLLQVEIPDIPPVNAIQMELKTLANSIENDSEPPVSIEDGFKALELAHQIVELIEEKGKANMPA